MLASVRSAVLFVALIVLAELTYRQSAEAETARDFVEFALAYAADVGYSLSNETEIVIIEGVEPHLSEISADPNLLRETHDAIRTLIDEMTSNALNQPDPNAIEKPELSRTSLSLALQNICPLWPICI